MLDDGRPDFGSPPKVMDCAICLQHMSRPWSPPTGCSCRITLHSTCWDRWVSHAHSPICVICRKGPDIQVPMHPPAMPQRMPDLDSPGIVLIRILIFLFVVWFFFRRVSFHFTYNGPLYNQHDEL